MLLTDPCERKSPKPFRFEQMWHTDPSFPSVVEQGWKASEGVPSTSFSLSRFPRRLESLTAQLRTWNKSHFRNLFQRKNRLLARLRGLQIALTTKPSAFLYSLEHQLTLDYNTLLHQEYLCRQLKSRVTWLNYGDVNTKFFHLTTLHRRSHSRVVTLKDTTGLWLIGDPLLAHINDTFHKLFQATSEYRRPSLRSASRVCLSSPFLEHTQTLSTIPLLDEILKALRHLPSLKAPRPDGFHALFFQTNWHVLGQSVIQIIQDIFEQLRIPPTWGHTNLVLIPKVAHPEQITQFHSISLCNTLYKLVSRILVQRLKPYMAEIINPCQAEFVPGRRTSDNIILVQEVIRTLRYRRGKTGYVVIKLDLEKAYDHLKWSFIQETLVFFQLPSNLITLIMNMISSTQFHILWNGMPLPEVVPS